MTNATPNPVPVKLTDGLLADINAALADYYGHDSNVPERRAADTIRALRDRARAVVESEHDDYGVGWIVNHVVDGDALDALREVLP